VHAAVECPFALVVCRHCGARVERGSMEVAALGTQWHAYAPQRPEYQRRPLLARGCCSSHCVALWACRHTRGASVRGGRWRARWAAGRRWRGTSWLRTRSCARARRRRARWLGAGRPSLAATWRRTWAAARAPSRGTWAASLRSAFAKASGCSAAQRRDGSIEPKMRAGGRGGGGARVRAQAALAGRVGRRVSAAERTHGEAAAALERTVEALRSAQAALLGEVGALRADNAALRSEVATLRGELSVQHDELAELRCTVQDLVAGGGAVGRHRDVAGPASAHGQSGAPGGAAAPARPPAPPPQPQLSAPAVNRAAAPPPPAIPTVPPGDGRTCAYTCARGERGCVYTCLL